MTTHLTVSATEVQTFQRCRRQWYVTSPTGLNLMPQRTPGALQVGKAIHAGLEAHYNHFLNKTPVAAFYEALGSEGEITDAGKAQLALEVLREYPNFWEQEDRRFTILGTEQKFQIALADDLELVGTIDLIVYDKLSKQFWIMDHKTTAQNYDIPSIARDLQFRTYVLAMRELIPTMPVTGIVVNTLKLIKIQTPRILQNGTVSREKITTTPHRYEREIFRVGGHPDAYEDVLKVLRYNSPIFSRHYHHFSDFALEEALHILRASGEGMRQVLASETPFYGIPSPKWDCQWTCDIAFECTAWTEYKDPIHLSDILIPAEARYTPEQITLTRETAPRITDLWQKKIRSHVNGSSVADINDELF